MKILKKYDSDKLGLVDNEFIRDNAYDLSVL